MRPPLPLLRNKLVILRRPVLPPNGPVAAVKQPKLAARTSPADTHASTPLSRRRCRPRLPKASPKTFSLPERSEGPTPSQLPQAPPPCAPALPLLPPPAVILRRPVLPPKNLSRPSKRPKLAARTSPADTHASSSALAPPARS